MFWHCCTNLQHRILHTDDGRKKKKKKVKLKSLSHGISLILSSLGTRSRWRVSLKCAELPRLSCVMFLLGH